jgi:hypothetical protein
MVLFALLWGGIVLAGCTGGVPAGKTGTSSEASASAGGSGTGGTSVSAEIPPGREIAEGGGGPAQYTFREEWRRALQEAQKWRSGAYLVIASGDMVNDDGVPSYWALNFIDKTDADAVLKLDIDAWGKVTQKRELVGSDVGSVVTKYTKRIPFDIIDSDQAVTLGKAALGSRHDLSKTKDPRLGLNISETDGSGPYWTYTLFDQQTAAYITARMDAMTGKAMPGE